VDGACIPKLGSTSPIDEHATFPVQLLILDSSDVEVDNLWDQIKIWKRENLAHFFLALCNVDPEMKIEKTAIALGVRGIFYNNAPQPQ